MESIGLSPRNVAHIDPASIKSSGFDTENGSEGGVEGGGGVSKVDITVHDSEDRDDDDEVTEANKFLLKFCCPMLCRYFISTKSEKTRKYVLSAHNDTIHIFPSPCEVQTFRSISKKRLPVPLS